MRRSFWILLTPTLLLILLGYLFDRIVAPAIIQVAVQKIEEVTKNQGPFHVKIYNPKLTYFPIGVKIQSLKLTPTKKYQSLISDIDVQQVTAELAIFALLTGKLKVSKVEIQSPSLQVNFQWSEQKSSSESKTIDLNWENYLKPLELLPIEQFNVYNLNLKIFDPSTRKSFSLSPVEIQLLKLPNLFQAQLSAPQISTSWDPKQYVQTQLEFSVVATPETFRIQNFELKNKTLNFNLSGQLKKGKKKNEIQTQMYWKSQISLDEVKGAIQLVAPDLKLPELKGQLQSQGSWKPTQNDFWKSDFQIQTENVQIEKFKIGNIEINGQFFENQIEFNQIKADHPAGQIVLTQTQLEFKDDFKIKTQIQLDTLDFHKLFVSLNLHQVPVYGLASGSAQCEGSLKNLSANCDFSAKTENIQIQLPKSELLFISTLSGQGTLSLNKEQIEFNSKLTMPKSNGEAKGLVNFRNGFDISYHTNLLDWSDVKNLSNLNLKGQSTLTGSTKGDSHKATFEINAQTNSTSLGGFFLGHTDISMNYESGQLRFPKVSLAIQDSTAQGELLVNLNDSTITGQIKSESMDLNHIRQILAEPIPLPIPMTGKGSLQIQFEGPLNFWKLNTQLQAQFVQPQIAGEIVNSVNTSVTSTDGNYQIQKLDIVRGKSLLSLTGEISSEKNLNLIGTLKNARLEESDNLSRSGWPLSGELNSQIKILGSLAQAQIIVSGQIAKMILNETEVPNSNFQLNIQNSVAQFEGSLFGKQIQTYVEWPLSSSQQKINLKFKSLDWDYTPWLSLFNAGAINEETQGVLTSDIQLESASGQWRDLNGLIRMDRLSLTRQGSTLSNTKPITVQVENGRYHTQNFILSDQNKGRLEIKSQNSSLDQLNLAVFAQIDLKLIQIFVPIFEEISGPLELNANLSGPATKPNLIGQMKISDAFLKIKGFPHPIEKISLDSSFSQSRVLFNQVTAELGGGSINGEGSLQFQGPRDIPLFVRARAKQVSLNIPSGVKTKGDADITISGRTPPYLLAIQYQVQSAYVDMNFGSDSTTDTLKQNYYLPKQLKEVTAEPLELDIQLSFLKPVQIKNNLMEAQVTGPLRVKGTPSQPLLIGQIKSLKGSRVLFKDKPFEIQTANIQFNNPREINPELFISAQTRVDNFDVSLLVQGTAKEPTIRLSSVPPLSDNDLTSLLALGVTSSQLADVKSSDQQAQTANEVFAAAFQSTGLSKKVQSATGFNVQLSNSFDTTRNISVPKFTVSRKLNKKTSASVAFPVTGDQKTPEGRIQYTLTDAFSVNGSYESRKFDQSTTNTEQREIPSILGLDLEFSKEFK